MPSSHSALVTGAAGFVGSVLARRLLAGGRDVHLLLRPETDRWRLDGLDAPVHEVDLTDADAVAGAVRNVRPDWIFHLAAYGGYSQQTDARRMLDVNVGGTMNLVQAALETGFDAFIHAGSSSEYGFVDHPPDEDECPRPGSDYAVAKAAATLYCRSAAERHGARISTLRLYSAYGPCEEPTRFIPTLVLAGLEGKLPSLVSPTIARDFVYVDDVAEAFVRTAEAAPRGAVYNVGTGTQVTIEEAVAVAREKLGIEDEPHWGSMPDRSWDTSTWVANPARIRSEVGWAPRYAFEEGFERTLAWFRDSPERIELYRARAARSEPRA